MMVRRACFSLALAILLASMCAVDAVPNPLVMMNTFSVFTCADLNSHETSFGGRLAVAGDCVLSDEGVGTMLEKNCTRFDLVVGGDLSMSKSQVAAGKAVYGEKLDVMDVSFACGEPQQMKQPISFDLVCDGLEVQSKIMRTLPVNGKATYSQTSQTLSLVGTDKEENVFLLSGDDLNGIALLDISVPLNAWTTITIEGNGEALGQFGVTLAPSTVLQKVLFNFVDATTISVSSLGFYGSILAPNADMSFDNGHIDGSVAVNNFEGNVEVKNYPYIPITCRCVCPPSITFPPYSIFVNGDMQMSDSSCGGALAVRGDLELRGYSAGGELTGEDGANAPLGNTVLVGGDLVWTEGGSKNGNVLVEGDIYTEAFGSDGYKVEQVSSLPIDFDQTQQRLEAVSGFLNLNLTSRGVVEWEFNTMYLIGTDLTINTFNVTQEELSDATSVIIRLPEDSDAWAVINIHTGIGQAGSLVGLNMVVEGTDASYVLINFPGAAKVTIAEIPISASVLAPYADVSFTSGGINGSLYCKSLSGSGPVNYHPPSPVYPPCPPCEC